MHAAYMTIALTPPFSAFPSPVSHSLAAPLFFTYSPPSLPPSHMPPLLFFLLFPLSPPPRPLLYTTFLFSCLWHRSQESRVEQSLLPIPSLACLPLLHSGKARQCFPHPTPKKEVKLEAGTPLGQGGSKETGSLPSPASVNCSGELRKGASLSLLVVQFQAAWVGRQLLRRLCGPAVCWHFASPPPP